MQEFRLVFFAAVLMMAIPGCGDGCNKDGGGKDPFKGQTCQAAKQGNPGAGGQYLCPDGYFCKYEKEEDMVNPHATGKCEAMDKYEECMTIVLCDSQYAPRCDTVNETAYCDWLHTGKRCRCDKPGPFTPIDGEGDGGDVKTPTTTK